MEAYTSTLSPHIYLLSYLSVRIMQLNPINRSLSHGSGRKTENLCWFYIYTSSFINSV